MKHATRRWLLALTLCLAPAMLHAATDYLSPQLRADVEALKQSVKTVPTTRANYIPRAKVAWDWMNAYAMTGRPIPVNITQLIRPVPAEGRVTKRAIQALDYYLDDLTLLDEEPDALGKLVADLGPFEARSWVTIHQYFTVGTRDIVPGGGFLIAHHFRPGYGMYQVNDPAGDNYLTLTSSNPSVTFQKDSAPMAGMHGGFGQELALPVFRVASGTLKPGDVVTITYGDTSGGGRGLLISPASTDSLPVPVYVAFDGREHVYQLPIQPIRVSGSVVAGVHAFAPSVVRPGEKFELSVRAQDRFYNRAKAPIPAFNVYINDQLYATTDAGDESITVLKDVSLTDPGVARITVASVDGTIRGEGNPILVSADAQKIYWGDTHGHSGFAEGIGTPDRFMQWAKEDARLDFVTHSEHDIWMDDYEWQVLVNNVSKYSEPGRFVSYLGYEWTTQNQQGGHHNVLFRDTINRERIPNQLYPTLSKLYQGLREHYDPQDVLVIPHAHQTGDYRQSDPELENLVEIMSQHGTFEWLGRMYLQHGHQVGFIAASDNHLGQPGYTSPKPGYMAQRGGLAAVLASDSSRDAIFDAMKAIKTYATTGDKIILDVNLNGTGMGQRTKFATERKIHGRVIGTAPIDTITIVRNDLEVWKKDYLTIDSGRYSDEETFYVTFSSPSIPRDPGDNPRGTRGWNGTLQVVGAEIAGFEATDFFSSESNVLERDPDDASMLHFATGTRGDTSSVKLVLRKIKRNAEVRLALNAAREQSSTARFRTPALLPATSAVLRFKDLEKGQTHVSLPVDVYEDRITLRRARVDGPSDVVFDFTDVSQLQGDYYFVRIKQANDATAWSSPIWVGGYPTR